MGKTIDITPNYMVVSISVLNEEEREWLFNEGMNYGLKAIWNDDEHTCFYVVILQNPPAECIPANILKYVKASLAKGCAFLGFAEGVEKDSAIVKVND